MSVDWFGGGFACVESEIVSGSASIAMELRKISKQSIPSALEKARVQVADIPAQIPVLLSAALAVARVA